LLFAPALVAVGLLVAIGVGVSLPAVQAQPASPFKTFLPIICHHCDPMAPPSFIQVTKTLIQPAGGIAGPGDVVDFKITITNTGSVTVTQLPLDDVFDARYLEYVIATPAPDIALPGSVQWRDLTRYLPRGFDYILAPGRSFDVIVQFRVVACPVNQPISNHALVSGAVDANGDEVRLAYASSLFDCTDPRLEVTQTMLPPGRSQAYYGEMVDFLVVLRNTGNLPIVTLPLAYSWDSTIFEFVSANPPPDVVEPGRLAWNNLTAATPLAPGRRLTVNVRLKVIGCPSDQATTNTATVNGAVARFTPTRGSPVDFSIPPITGPITVNVPCAELQIHKIVAAPASGIARLGDLITFTLDIVNTGNKPIAKLPVQDIFDPTLLALVSTSPATSPPVEGHIDWDDLLQAVGHAGFLQQGESVSASVTFRVTSCPVNRPAINRARINGAIAIENGQEHQVPVVSDTVSFDIACPQVAIAKRLVTPTIGSAFLGEFPTFEIKITNTGNKPITTLPLVDTYNDAYLTFSVASIPPDLVEPGRLTWNDLVAGAPLLPGKSISITVKFIASGCPADQTTTNTAAIHDAVASQDGTTFPVPDVSASASVDIPCARLKVTKTLTSPAGGEVLRNGLATFTVTIKNEGNKPVTTLPLVDEYDPRYLEFVEASIRPDSALGASLEWLDLTRDAPYGFGRDLAPGDTFSLTLTFKAVGCPADQTTVNEVRVTGAVAQHEGREFAVPPASATAQVDIACPEIKVTKRLIEPAGGPALIHEPVVFSITVENTGNKTVTVLPLEDNYNAQHLQFKSSDVPPSSVTPGQVKWNDLTQVFGDLPPGSAISVRLTFETIGCPRDQTTPDQARVQGAIAQHGGTTYTVPMAMDTAVATIACPDILVTKTLVSPADGVINRFDPNDTATFQITIQATGNKDITVLPLEDNFNPSYLEVVSASPTPNIMIPGVLKWNDLTRPGPNGFGRELKIGETFTVTVTVRGVGCPPGQVVTNYAEVKGAWGRHDGNYFLIEPASHSADVRVACPLVRVTKTLVPLVCGVAGINDPVTFHVMVENIGNTTLQRVTLYDTYSAAYLRFDSAQPPPTGAGIIDSVGTLVWDDLTGPVPHGFNRDLPPGEAFNVVVNFTAIQSTQALFPRVTTNFAGVSGVDEYGHTTVDQPSSHVAVDVEITDADLFITKQIKPDSLLTYPGGLVTYQVTYGNNGPDNANFIRILDTIPVGTEFVSDTLCGHVNTGCYLDNLAAGAGGSFEVTIRVPFGTAPGIIETNRISIESGHTPDGPVCGIPDRNMDNNVTGASSTVWSDFGRLNDPTTYSEDFTHEWLGAVVLGEASPPDGEAENDSWLNKQPQYRAGRLIELDILMNTAGEGAARYGPWTDAERRLYLRGWLDRNRDGVFADDELIVAWSGGPGMVGVWDFPPNAPLDGIWPLNEPTHRFRVWPQFTAPFIDGGTWIRFRLGYGKVPSASGVEHYGEIEDHWVEFVH
jgi:uncharacterized repeat protein (TIGR01451 family)